jgi:DNA-binding transcriptional LysR family regulator
LGDTEREPRLLPALTHNQELVVVHRSLAADELLERIRAGGVDVALLAGDLHRLSVDRQRELLGSGVPVVVLSAPAEQAQWRSAGAAVVDLDAGATDVREAISAVLEGTVAAPLPVEEVIEAAVGPGNDSGDSIADGATQWMTAGAGILHDELPTEELVMKGGLFHGVQL